MASFFILDKFQEYLAFERRFSNHTCLAYIKDLEQFFRFSNFDEQDLNLEEVNHQLVRAWVVDLLEHKADK